MLDKHDTPSWNEMTRRVIDERLSLKEDEGTLVREQLETLRRLVARVAPQPERRPPATTVAIVLQKIASNSGDGFRPAGFPQVREAWLCGLDALEAEARECHAACFADLDDDCADILLRRVASGNVRSEAWAHLSSSQFWKSRVLPDILSAHWAHPSLWSAMGFGGPAGPRGYVRLDANRRDGWEAQEEEERA
ncbi:uncharacterized protein PY1_contig-12-49 [Novosphingobium sp. PY1]|nr:uncharacterized protein PY1_contig-12-49 [Novosphingobium sp. PY1]